MARGKAQLHETAESERTSLLAGEAVARWFADAATRRRLQALAAWLRRQPGCDELTAHPAWPRAAAVLRPLLGTIHRGAPGEGPLGDPPGDASSVMATPRCEAAAGGVRIVAWNILKGIAFEEICETLTAHPALRDADLLLLSEVDVGMVRSGNRHIAAELGARLGRHWAFLPSFLELTKGPGAEGRVPGRNAIGLHGLAILSRAAPRALWRCPLPDCFDAFAFSEKRFGRRAGLLAELPGPWIVGVVHLEVRGTPRCRARQMEAFLAHLERFRTARRLARETPVLIAGDLNSHTFARGSLHRAAAGALRLLAVPRHRLARQLQAPWRAGREPLFRHAARAGFTWKALNDRQPTASERLGRVEDWELLPAPWRERLAGGLGLRDRELGLRLDWFLGRGIDAAQVRSARTVPGLGRDRRPSDHAPIVLELHDATAGPERGEGQG
ncbi:MAG: hypothetical protein GF330_13140 [Candidatus Eisenbacteria bacterium]|nr:hypothetical protein [Candidatus Eisenbacteria bacterium]